MRMYDLILKKRKGEALTKEEIYFFIEGYTKGSIPDYQVSALLMAVYFQKMNKEETVYLTEAMMHSGEVIDLSSIEGIKVDKHSTGGVGDKTTIALAPIAAACGIPVAKMSGRGLGHTGGTIDKLESIPGFCVEMTKETFIQNVNVMKLAIAGQTANLTPADKKLYALRDVTATVDNISLIASSIMSKKLASGADAIVLDVKTGSGAFMQDIDEAFLLAKEMVDIGNRVGRETVAIVTDMNQPLGYAIGNSLEVKEAVQLLKGEGPKDLEKLCITLGAHMLLLGKKVGTEYEGKRMAKAAIDSGEALNVLKNFVKQQNGQIDCIENLDLLPKTKEVYSLKADKRGYIHKIQGDIVGASALTLGAGRDTKDSKIDLSVGILLNKKMGDYVETGEVLAYIHYNDENRRDLAIEQLLKAYEIEDEAPEHRPLIFGVVTKNGIQRI
ncbi:pyrimidine-nucleoside phosphorylase [Clostridium formicaceticum]|uniref:Pyrimidine-nucleoside phosphorylase n=1 Tax=Clostridium formicaceticum TaxID=1497 RepID=A0AAC9WHE0_9CLOT|nr:pyrimidine-nucleoside phosphorylase [Clostridium formicaceticum]AOY77091.1 pyrimidine-nucleoside phosphorylase [Clostridium formicaceticum]ARE87600.1 Pyrimidine-nucleoside phosphorylase [Clostridium formicaceticum]